MPSFAPTSPWCGHGGTTSTSAGTVDTVGDSTWVLRLTDYSPPTIGLNPVGGGLDLDPWDQAPLDNPLDEAEDTFGVQYTCLVGSERSYPGSDDSAYTVDVLIQGDWRMSAR